MFCCLNVFICLFNDYCFGVFFCLYCVVCTCRPMHVLIVIWSSGRYVKREQWERWRAKQKLGVRVQAPGVLLRLSGAITPSPRNWLRLYIQNLQSSVFLSYFNTLTMGTAFPREMTPDMQSILLLFALTVVLLIYRTNVFALRFFTYSDEWQ